MARPKTEYYKDIRILQKQANMLKRGAEMLDDRWDEIVNSMIDFAVKKRSVTAATWLRDTFIGKPIEQVKVDAENETQRVFGLAYNMDKLKNVVSDE